MTVNRNKVYHNVLVVDGDCQTYWTRLTTSRIVALWDAMVLIVSHRLTHVSIQIGSSTAADIYAYRGGFIRG